MSIVSIIGAGQVGTSCAAAIAERDFASDITIIDTIPGLAEGKALDLRQSAALKRFDTRVKGVTADFCALAGSDVVVIASGAPRKPGMQRSELLASNAAIVKDVARQVALHAPDSIVVVVSNPLDVLCYCVFKNCNFPPARVMGMSGLLDVARYKSFIADALHVSTKDIQALIMGGHGSTMVPMPRYTTVGGIPIRYLLSEDEIRCVIRRTQLGGDEIISHLGRSGWHAAGAAVCEMVESIICDQHRVFPVCAFLNGQYGCSDIFIGVPAILGRNGVERVIELDLDPDDRERFIISQREVRASMDNL